MIQPNQKQIQIAIKGKWYTVPALEVCGKDIVVSDGWLRIARVEAEEWLETELEDPLACIELLKQQKYGPLHADVLSFRQKLPDVQPKYKYPMEWDSVAAIPLKSFSEWWEGLPQETRKNVRPAAFVTGHSILCVSQIQSRHFR